MLEEADGSAKKMSCHNEADEKVTVLKVSIMKFFDISIIIDRDIMCTYNIFIYVYIFELGPLGQGS